MQPSVAVPEGKPYLYQLEIVLAEEHTVCKEGLLLKISVHVERKWTNYCCKCHFFTGYTAKHHVAGRIIGNHTLKVCAAESSPSRPFPTVVWQHVRIYFDGPYQFSQRMQLHGLLQSV